MWDSSHIFLFCNNRETDDWSSTVYCIFKPFEGCFLIKMNTDSLYSEYIQMFEERAILCTSWNDNLKSSMRVLSLNFCMWEWLFLDPFWLFLQVFFSSCSPGSTSWGAGAVPGGVEGDKGPAAAGACPAGRVPQRAAPHRADRNHHDWAQQQDQTLAERGVWNSILLHSVLWDMNGGISRSF